MAGPAKLRCTLVSTIKDEGPYLLEWLAYYKVIGFSHAEVFYNNCNDLSDDMLRALSRRTNFVTCHENSKKASGDHYDPQ
ncbi:MAG: glycosyltransferase family 2 protein, partial [Planktomarina sp.]